MTIHEQKAMAGRLGGLATVRKYGREYMRAIGKRGAAVLWERYSLQPWDTSGWALMERSTGKIISTW